MCLIFFVVFKFYEYGVVSPNLIGITFFQKVKKILEDLDLVSDLNDKRLNFVDKLFYH